MARYKFYIVLYCIAAATLLQPQRHTVQLVVIAVSESDVL